MVFNNNKKGQAAIEFLMTYGWMLLVVLIVGALIFSFIDFGALLPNKLDLNNNLRASATESYASANAGGNSYALVVFTYSGAKQVKIGANLPDSYIVSSIVNTEQCSLSWIKNVDTDAATAVNEPLSGLGALNLIGTGVVFLNGHTGIAVFDCSTLNSNSGLFENDALEGKIVLAVENAKTGVKTPSSGPIRLTIGE